MNTTGCGCETTISRRRMLKTAGLVAAAAAMAGSGEAATGARAQAESRRRQILGTAGVRAIDMHAHYYPKVFFDLVEEEGKRFNASYRMTGEVFEFQTPAGTQTGIPINMMDLKGRIADMDQQGVAIHVLSLTNPMTYWGDAEFSHKLSKAYNDGASAAHLAFPDRLVALMTLPMLHPDRAIDELNRASKLPGMRGIYLGTNINNRDLDDPLFEPVFARIEALDLPVFLHPLQPAGGDREKQFYLEVLIGFPIDTALAASHLIFGGVLDRHPKLQISLPHGGGALPMLMGRLDRGWQVRPEIKSLKMPHPPSAYLQRFTYDTIVHSKPVMEFLIQQVGVDRILMGSDYCFNLGYDRPVEFVDQINLTGAQRKKILGENVARLLKL